MRLNKIIIAISFLVGFYSCKQVNKHADLIIYGGKIYTADKSNSIVEAVVVNADTIVFTGTKADALNWTNKKTKHIDLKNKIMTPGFIESHGHFMGVGYNELNLDLQNTRSFEEVIQRVQNAVARSKPGQWIVGRGWHQDKWDSLPAMIKGFPIHDALSKISPDNPVWLTHASGHMSLANKKAMELAGVTVLSKEQHSLKSIEGGEIIKDQLGNPTGMFVENAKSIIEKYIPLNDSTSDMQAAELAIQACLRNGITSFDDAGASRTTIALLKKNESSGRT